MDVDSDTESEINSVRSGMPPPSESDYSMASSLTSYDVDPSMRSESPESVLSLTDSMQANFQRQEYGRGLQTYSELYRLPADEQELERLDKQHTIFVDIMGEKYAPPMEAVMADDVPGETKACLDLGCGSGSWSEVDDVNLGLEHFYGDFNVVHARLISSGVKDYHLLVDQMCRVLRPHGLLDISEFDFHMYDKDHNRLELGTHEVAPPWWARWMSFLAASIKNIGGDVDAATHLHEWVLSNPLFEDVVYREFWLPIVPPPYSPNETEATRRFYRKMKENTTAFLGAGRPLLLGSGLPEEIVDTLEQGAIREMEERKVTQYTRLQCVYARKKVRYLSEMKFIALEPASSNNTFSSQLHAYVSPALQDYLIKHSQMDMNSRLEVIDRIVNPSIEDASKFLARLQLAETPTASEVHNDIEKRLLLPPSTFPDQWLPSYQISVPDLLNAEPAPPPTVLNFIRSGLDGRVTGYRETVPVRQKTGSTSTSLDRTPAPSKNFVRGKSGYVPFWPGGFEDTQLELSKDSKNTEQPKGIRTIPPGFERGLRLPGDPVEDENLVDFEQDVEADVDEAENEADVEDEIPLDQTKEVDALLPASRSNLRPVGLKKRRMKRVMAQTRDWAHVIDVNMPLTNFHELVPEMAHKYPFELDTFQKQAVYHLEMGDSVFVAAHTSAGKTVVAEYAIALAEKHMTRAIYTSPIKALSNQKFRDFKQTFSSSSVGILTGDVQINPEASCLIMTTEILRSMLYKGADLIRDVEFVIFDEVHYVNDAERGVVWEEVIIMLPDHVNIILLSATVPNTKEFADWVGRTKKKDIYVISTPQRPVPLEHYLYAGRDTYKIVDAQRNFVSQGYKEAGEALRRKQDKEREAAGLPPVQRVGARGTAPAQRGQQRGGGGRGGPVPLRGGRGGSGGAPGRTIHTGADKNLYVHLLGHLRKKALLPVVVFTFSKKRCEENAATLTNADLCTSVEKSEVHVAVEKALARLKGSDRKLPQIVRTRDLLSRGIGIHHGGLLPLVKELVEILFARGLVKILFATETFAMGVNMPAKCVVFSSIRKHDGRNFRDILPGEYTQMAGRAGRRGLDPTGTVIIIANDNLPEQTTLHTMILGVPGKLSSQFRLTYNMILNLLRVEALRVEEMIKRSFSENSSQRLLPEQQQKVIESERSLSALPRLDCPKCLPDIEHHYDQTRDIIEKNQSLLEMALSQSQGSKILNAGRVVILRDGHFRLNNVAVILKQAPIQTLDSGLLAKVKTYFVLAWVHPNTKSGGEDIESYAIPPAWPIKPQQLKVESGVYELTAVPLTSIVMVSNRMIQVQVNDIVDRHLISRMKDAISSLQSVVEEWSSGESIPEVDWSRMRSLEFQEVLRSRDFLVRQIQNNICVMCPDFDHHYRLIHGQKILRANIAFLKLAISDQNLELIPDYEQRIAVLKDLKFIDENSTIQLKGRVACEINSANELVLTELILENTLASYDPEEVVALLSCFVFQEKTDVEPLLSPKLEVGRDAIVAISDRVGRVQDFHKVSVEEFRSNLKFGLVEVVYEWAKGMPFEQITALTDVAEGTIVRVITRLDETCREVRDAARVIGDAELFKKMEECQIKIKRDIVFAASLYF
ncbi:Putative ATP-dependent RNA helicase [Psilocybe cubensis]|uniref:ATP-dependent RNA helicase n=1 Tax=Psilocybe cubensis TaxID=181762 RepID=A0ACB8HGU6_PSICU|nr:Putative ATP-dependent RNA helicase [Psilocybe cubensis]KAH9486365.1 Putative ATP-dependent RNA helicase [Psilocybe cubensis]